MPITTQGSDIALQRNPTNGKFTFSMASDGNPTLTNSAEHQVLTQLVEWRGVPGDPGWWADTTGEHGSRLRTIKHDKTSTASQVEQYVLEALQPLVDRRVILGPPALTARANRVAPGRFTVDITYSVPGQKPQSLRVTVGY